MAKPAGLCQRQSAGLPGKKPVPRIRFQPLHLLRHGTSRHMHLIRRQTEVQVPGREVKGTQSVNVGSPCRVSGTVSSLLLHTTRDDWPNPRFDAILA